MSVKHVECEVEELYRWIDNYPLSRQKRNISRDFSDAVPLAEIIKQHYPKLVELHNYTPKNAVSQKLVNWQTLNKKVLHKLDIKLSITLMEKIAQAIPGSVEKVLFDVKEKLTNQPVPPKHSEDVFYVEGLSEPISGSVIQIKHKDGVKTVNHKVVPVDTFTEMENTIEEKNQAIIVLKNKLHHLESLLKIKDERINDLTKQLQGCAGDTNSTTSKFSFKSPRFINLF